MNQKNKNYYYFILVIFCLAGCIEPYTPDTRETDQQFVVEGFIEYGDGSLPTYVLVTKSIPFITEVSREQFESIFVDNATVTVSDGDKIVPLFRLCASDPNLPDEIKEAVAQFFGIEGGDDIPNICVYLDIANGIQPQEGKRYDLEVLVDDNKFTASTTIPRHIPLTEFRWDDPPGDPVDTLAQLWVKIDDLPGADYFRYFTAVRGRNLVPNVRSSVDDVIFDGKEFEFPLNRAPYLDEERDPNTFGLFFREDSVSIKWMTMDAEHYNFWNTRDFSSNNGGPFASYTRIAGNVDGALGVWGGYHVSNYTIFCPPK